MTPRIEGPSAVRPSADRRRKMEAAPPAATDAAVEGVSREAGGDDQPGPFKERRRKGQDRRREPRLSAWRPHAPLVAQLIATAVGMAQTRSRRRAAVAEALDAYRKDETPPKTPRGVA